MDLAKASRYDNERYFKCLRTRKCIELLLEFLDTEDMENRGCSLRVKGNITYAEDHKYRCAYDAASILSEMVEGFPEFPKI
ncbi:MAG: hypothetical protein IPL35_14920 [Sphingobacteriales bacterium]|nr:hypothetical protein [Sphingobacteriales bacterium]